MVRGRFQSSVNITGTRNFPGADIGSDHNLVMMTFKFYLKKSRKQGQIKPKFDLEKLKDSTVLKTFQAMVGGTFTPLTILDADYTDMDSLINNFNAAVTDTVSEILGKHRTIRKPWISTNIFDLCNKWRGMKKKKKSNPKGAKQYRTVNQQVQSMRMAKDNCIEEQYQDREGNLKNNSKKACQLVKVLTSTKQGRNITIQDKAGKFQTEDQDILQCWNEYCSELYSYRATGDATVLLIPPATNNDNHPILRDEVEAAVGSLKKGKPAGMDNIPSEQVQAGEKAMNSVLLIICNKI